MARKSKLIRPYDEENWSLDNSAFFRCIRRINRNHLIAALLILLLIITLDTRGTVLKYLHYLRGPVELSGEQLADGESDLKLKNVGFTVTVENSKEYDKNPMLLRSAYVINGVAYVRLSGDGFTDSGIAPKAVNTGEINNPMMTGSDSAYTGEEQYIEYKLLQLGDKYLITKIPLDAYYLDLKGIITYLPADMKLEVVRASGVDPDAVLGYFFDATGEAFSHSKTEIAFSILLILLWLPYFLFVLRRIRHPDRSPLYKQVFVLSGPVEENARALDRELGGPGCYGTTRRTVTPNWIVTQRLFSAEIKFKDRR